jgi:hypothetical protein
MSGAMKSQRVLGIKVVMAQRFWPRLRGLLGKRALATGEALLLSPCSNVHTCFLRFAIDIVFLNKAGDVVAIHAGVRPWRVRFAREAYSCLELASGGAHRCALRVGQRIPQLSAARLAAP